MSLPPGLAAARKPITLACAALAALAILGALVYSFQATGNDCGSGWAAARKPLPDPLLTPEEQAAIQRDNRNPYDAAVAKAKPINDCRRAGNRRLITAGVGGLLVLLPAGAVFAYVNWPRREELTEIVLTDDDDADPLVTGRRGPEDRL